MKNFLLNKIFYINWNYKNLLPIIIQEILTKNILMFAWVNPESLIKTLTLGNIYYYSRSKIILWNKGFKSKNIQYYKYFYLDCDLDCLLLKIFQVNNICCHFNLYTCFLNKI